MTDTPNHSYNAPEQGTNNWHVPLNENWGALDTDVEIRDADANKGNYDAKQGAKFVATDTGAVYLGTGNAWELCSRQVSELNTENVNNEVYASRFDGAGLASKVENALTWLQNNVGGQGRVRVTPKDDGTAWTWDKDLTLNPFNFESLAIDIDTNAVIEYPGTGWALTLDSGGQYNNDRQNVVLSGGTWIATASSASGELGCVRAIDIGNSVFRDMYIDFNVNVSASTHGIRFENKARWSEMNTIAVNYVNADYCLQFVGASFNPDSTTGGSQSFQGTQIRGGNFHCQTIGLDFRGNMQYSQVNAPQVFLFSDGAYGLRLDSGGSQMRGFVINGGKTEEHASNTSSFRFGDSYDGFYDSPTLVGGFYQHPTNMISAATNASNTQLFHMVAEENSLKFHAHTASGESSVNITSEPVGTGLSTDIVTIGRNTEYGPVDVTTIPSWQIGKGAMAYNDGTTGTEGPAFYNGTAWTSLVDGTTIS